MQKTFMKGTLYKPIKCPCCGRRLADENCSSNTQIITNLTNACVADYYIKCPKCTTVIGFKKIK